MVAFYIYKEKNRRGGRVRKKKKNSFENIRLKKKAVLIRGYRKQKSVGGGLR